MRTDLSEQDTEQQVREENADKLERGSSGIGVSTALLAKLTTGPALQSISVQILPESEAATYNRMGSTGRTGRGKGGGGGGIVLVREGGVGEHDVEHPQPWLSIYLGLSSQIKGYSCREE